MKSSPNFDISMFSGHENSTRTPPEARRLEHHSYVGSGSMTQTDAEGSSSPRKQATLDPIRAPPTTATS